MIKLENVSYCYEGDCSVVNELSFEIKKGEFAALIGENGAGKTTITKLINGLIKPGSGIVTVAGLDTKKTKTSLIARHVGYLFQNPDRQICQNTVRAEIGFGLRLQGRDKEEADQKADSIIKEFGLDGDKDPFTLSRGERQRVALASILAVEPEIIILDEPTTGLDYLECMQVMNAVAALNKEGVTVLMVCHDMEVVLDFAQRVLVVSGGRLLAEGRTREIFRNTELMERASVLPPQLTQLAIRLGEGFERADTTEEMVDIIKQKRGAR